jgi:acetyl esterase/lipase
MSFATVVNNMSYDIKKQNENARYDNLLNLNANCPPFFIFQTHLDDPRFAMNFGKALADYGIPFEVHTFANGGHGGGLYDGGCEHAPLQRHTARWADLAVEWLEDLQF